MKSKNIKWLMSLLLLALAIFLTSCSKNTDEISVTDKDGNVYKSVTIGDQVWMAENLKSTKYNDGTAIPNITDNTAWSNLITSGFCWYNNEVAHKNTYGALYNWYTVNTGKLCPTGWHVPSENEWTELITNVGGEPWAGGKLKESGTLHWRSPNYNGTNESGFTALPGGNRNTDGTFDNIGDFGYWWSANDSYYEPASAVYRYMRFDGMAAEELYNSKIFGFSVRCIKD